MVMEMIVTSDIDQFSIVQVICGGREKSGKNAMIITTFYAKSHQYTINKIPKEIFNMINMVRLGFSHIKIKIIPKRIINLKALQHLYLNYCSVTVMNFNIINTMLSQIQIAGSFRGVNINGTMYYYSKLDSNILNSIFYNNLGQLCNVNMHYY